jgi:hypothetical protein
VYGHKRHKNSKQENNGFSHGTSKTNSKNGFIVKMLLPGDTNLDADSAVWML